MNLPIDLVEQSLDLPNSAVSIASSLIGIQINDGKIHVDDAACLLVMGLVRRYSSDQVALVAAKEYREVAEDGRPMPDVSIANSRYMIVANAIAYDLASMQWVRSDEVDTLGPVLESHAIDVDGYMQLLQALAEEREKDAVTGPAAAAQTDDQPEAEHDQDPRAALRHLVRQIRERRASQTGAPEQPSQPSSGQ